MTKKENETMWRKYESSVRLACSYYVTMHYDRARDILYAVSAFMYLVDGFSMYSNKPLRAILKGYGIEFNKFVDIMSGANGNRL